MARKVNKIEVWVGEMDDQPGGLAKILKGLADAGVSLDGVIARRQPDKPGTGVVFLSPIKSKKAKAAAHSLGLRPAMDVGGLRVEGPDKAGIGAKLTGALAEAGINMRGLSALAIGKKFVAYFGFDNNADAANAAKVLRRAKL
ncbi:MAG: ACT domain-containing protein [bacterium]